MLKWWSCVLRGGKGVLRGGRVCLEGEGCA